MKNFIKKFGLWFLVGSLLLMGLGVKEYLDASKAKQGEQMSERLSKGNFQYDSLDVVGHSFQQVTTPTDGSNVVFGNFSSGLGKKYAYIAFARQVNSTASFNSLPLISYDRSTWQPILSMRVVAGNDPDNYIIVVETAVAGGFVSAVTYDIDIYFLKSVITPNA